MISCLPYSPQLGIEPETLWFTGQHPKLRSHLARAGCYFVSNRISEIWNCREHFLCWHSTESLLKLKGRSQSSQCEGFCTGVLSWCMTDRLPVLWHVTSRGVLRGKASLSLAALGVSSQLIFVQGRGAGRVKLLKYYTGLCWC